MRQQPAPHWLRRHPPQSGGWTHLGPDRLQLVTLNVSGPEKQQAIAYHCKLKQLSWLWVSDPVQSQERSFSWGHLTFLTLSNFSPLPNCRHHNISPSPSSSSRPSSPAVQLETHRRPELDLPAIWWTLWHIFGVIHPTQKSEHTHIYIYKYIYIWSIKHGWNYVFKLLHKNFNHPLSFKAVAVIPGISVQVLGQASRPSEWSSATPAIWWSIVINFGELWNYCGINVDKMWYKCGIITVVHHTSETFTHGWQLWNNCGILCKECILETWHRTSTILVGALLSMQGILFVSFGNCSCFKMCHCVKCTPHQIPQSVNDPWKIWKGLVLNGIALG